MASFPDDPFGDQAIAHSVPDPRCGGRSQSPRSERQVGRRRVPPLRRMPGSADLRFDLDRIAARRCYRVIPPAPQLANSALVRGQRPERLRGDRDAGARPARGEEGVRGWGARETRISADWDLFLARELAIRPCNSPHCCCQSRGEDSAWSHQEE
jgi:hypothetical protein